MATKVADFDLTKRVEVLDRFLLQKGLHTAPTMRVLAALDISGSMSNAINQGHLQKALNQVMGVGYKFDDDGQVDMFKFDDRAEYVGTCSPADYKDYVRSKGIRARGGTQFAPIIRELVNFAQGGAAGGTTARKLLGLFTKAAAPAASKAPALALILTDGDCTDVAVAERELEAAQAHDIYFHFVAVGNGQFRTIRRLADALPNVGDVYLRDFGLSDDEVYAQVVSDELVQWIGKHK